MPKGRISSSKKVDFIFIVVLFILTLIYFAPVLSPSKMMYGSDWLLSGYTDHAFWASYVKSHWRFPMWDNYNFSGHPTVASTGGGGMVYPPFVLFLIFPVYYGWTLLFVLHIFLAGLGMFWLLRVYRLSSFVAFIGALIFMFSGQLITTTYGGHLGRLIGIVFLPYAFLLLYKAFENKRVEDFIFFGGVTGLFLLGGHSQISYWGMIGVLSYFLTEFVHRRKELGKAGFFKIGGFFSIGMFVLLLIILIKFLPPAFSLGYGARGVTRGYNYSTSWSIPTSELLDLIAPHFSGILENYWGENPFKLDSRYLGILPLVLLVFSPFYKGKKYLLKFFLWFVGISLFLGLGKNTPLFKIYYYLIPMAKKFRGPSMFFYLVVFGICVLSAFGAEAILEISKEKKEKRKDKMFSYLIGIIGFVFLFTLIVTILDKNLLSWMRNHFAINWVEVLSKDSISQKIYIMNLNFEKFKKSLWLSFLLFFLNGILIMSILKKKIAPEIVFPFLVVIFLFFDLWPIDRKYLSSVAPPDQYFAADDVTSFIKERKDLFRVFPLGYDGRSTDGYFHFHQIENVGGYGANPPARYQKFIGAGESVMFNPINLIRFPHLLSLLNVKYIVGPRLPQDLSGYDERVKEIIKEYNNFYSNFEVAFVGRKYQVLENRDFIPKFSLVDSFVVVRDPETVLNKVLSSKFEKDKVVFLEEEVERKISLSKELGKIEVIKNIANERVLNVETKEPSFLLVSENYHPDWKCYIDGKKEKIYKADYILYGVFIPEGKHKVSFVYESKVFNIASLLSFIGFLIFLGTFIVYFFRRR
ncbi:MAG: YfhO family protein [candidate division WOR-3 bacterium]